MIGVVNLNGFLIRDSDVVVIKILRGEQRWLLSVKEILLVLTMRNSRVLGKWTNELLK